MGELWSFIRHIHNPLFRIVNFLKKLISWSVPASLRYHTKIYRTLGPKGLVPKARYIYAWKGKRAKHFDCQLRYGSCLEECLGGTKTNVEGQESLFNKGFARSVKVIW